MPLQPQLRITSFSPDGHNTSCIKIAKSKKKKGTKKGDSDALIEAL